MKAFFRTSAACAAVLALSWPYATTRAQERAYEFQPIFERACDDEHWNTSEQGVFHGWILYIAGWGLTSLDAETGEKLIPPEDSAERRHLLLSTPEGLVAASEGPLDSGSGYTDLRLLSEPGTTAWRKGADIGVHALAFSDGVLFAADRHGNAAALNAATGGLIFRASRPVAVDLPPDTSVVERTEGLLAFGQNAIVLTERVERRTAKIADIPKGQPYSWERGMPEGTAYYVSRRSCAVRSYGMPRPDEPARALWELLIDCQDIVPGPSIFAGPEGAAYVFAGDKTVLVDLASGREKSRCETKTPLSFFEFAGADSAIVQSEGFMRCVDLRTLSEKWRVRMEEDPFLECAAGTRFGLVSMCVDSVREDDLIIMTDAILRLHDRDTGAVIAMTRIRRSGSSHLFCSEDTVFVHGSDKMSGFRIVSRTR